MDQNNLIVYLEFEDGRVADVSLELLTKGRVLASRLGVKLEAIVIGDDLTGVEQQVFPYGVDRLYKSFRQAALSIYIESSFCSSHQPFPRNQASGLSHGRYLHWS